METLHLIRKGCAKRLPKLAMSLVWLVFLPLSLMAQSLSLTSSSPANLSAQVDLSTVVSFTFNKPLETSQFEGENVWDVLMVMPRYAIDIQGVQFSNNNQTVSVTVTHEPNTDYGWAFWGVRAADGDALAQMSIVQYTTASSISPYTVSGQLSFVNRPMNVDKKQKGIGVPSLAYFKHPEKLRSFFAEKDLFTVKYTTASGEVNFAQSGVLLVDNLEFMNDEMSDGPQDVTRSMTVAETDGSYSMKNVRNGEYYAIAFLFDFEQGGGEPFAMGVYSVDDVPTKVQIQDGNLSNIDITVYGFNPTLSRKVDAREAYEVVKTEMASIDPTARALVVWGKESDDPLDFLKTSTHLVPAPTGLSYFWMVVYYSDTQERVHFFYTIGEEILEYETYLFSELPPDERPDFDVNQIQTIPDNFLSSAQVATLAYTNGLNEMLELQYQQKWEQVEYQVSAFFFEYEEQLNPESPPYWVVMYDGNGTNWDPVWEAFELEAYYLFDAVSGTFIAKDERVIPLNMHEPIRLEQTNPRYGETGVNGEYTLEYTFSETVYFPSFSPHSLGFTYWVARQENFSIQNWNHSEDQRTIYITANHHPNSNYSWAIMGVRGMNQNVMDKVEIFNYTGNESMPQRMISGDIINVSNRKAQAEALADIYPDSKPRLLVALIQDDHYFEGPMDNMPQGIRHFGTLIQPHSTSYSLNNVEPGYYFVVGMIYDVAMEVPQLMAVGFHKDDQGRPVMIDVTSMNADNILIDFSTPEPTPEVDVLEIMPMIRNIVEEEIAEPMFVLAYGREEYRDTNPYSGKSPEWMLIYYNHADEMVNMFNIEGYDLVEHRVFPLTEIPEEERIPIGSIGDIGDTFIGSQQAFEVALANGLQALINAIPNNVPHFSRIQYELTRFHFHYPEFMTPESNPYWRINFRLEVWDNEGPNQSEIEKDFLVDAITGAFIDPTVTSISDKTEQPSTTMLHQNYPNPFNPNTIIPFELATSGKVVLEVFDMNGRKIHTLINEHVNAGRHEIRWNAQRLASGMFVLRMRTASGTYHKKMTLIK